jgi:hypothetical protein
MSSFLTLAVLALAVAPINACNFHTKRSTSFSNPHTGTVHKRAEGREAIDWEYATSFDWHTIKEGTYQTGIAPMSNPVTDD